MVRNRREKKKRVKLPKSPTPKNKARLGTSFKLIKKKRPLGYPSLRDTPPKNIRKEKEEKRRQKGGNMI